MPKGGHIYLLERTTKITEAGRLISLSLTLRISCQSSLQITVPVHSPSVNSTPNYLIPILLFTFFCSFAPQDLYLHIIICYIESILTGCITAWYGNCSALQRVVCTTQYITGAKLPAIQDLYTRRCKND